MALERGARPDLVAGTITLTANSLNFSVSGIDFDVMSVRPGDTIITRSGLWLVIDQITSATAGTLAFVCPAAAAGNNQPLRIRFQPEGSRLMGQAANILARLNSGNLTSLADLDTAENKGIMFTGPGTAGTFDFPQRGRDLLAGVSTIGLSLGTAANTSDAKNAIGLGNVENTSDANKPVSTATQTALNGKVNRTGDTGLSGNYSTSGTFRANSVTAVTTIGADQGLRAGVYASYAGYCELAAPRASGTVGANNFTGAFSGNIGGANLSFSLFGLERVGTEVIASLGVRSGSMQTYFEFAHTGALRVPGALTAGSKSFKIDHVKDPYNRYLVYMSTEAPKAGIEDWGSVRLVNGQAEVDMDIAAGQMSGTFAALTQRAIVVSVNNLDSHTRVRAGRIIDGKFTIFADDPDCDDEVTWTVKAERADPFIKSHPYCDPVTGRLIPEHEKED